MSSIVKFDPAHFPVGTVFTLNEDMCLGQNSGKMFTTKKIIQTIEFEYLVETTTEKNQNFFKGMNETFHLDHVIKINKRGPGSIVIDNANSDENRNREMIEMIERNLSFVREKCLEQGISLDSNDVAFFPHYLSHLVWLYGDAPITAKTDEDKIHRIFHKTRCHQKYYHCDFGFIFVIKKKVLKNWIKKNQNRFLINVKKYKKETEQMLQSLYDDEYEAETFDDPADQRDSEETKQRQERINALVEQALEQNVSFEPTNHNFNGSDDFSN